MSNDSGGIEGVVTWELRGPDGELKSKGLSHNIITDVGDSVYATNGAGGGTITPLAKPTGMRLGTGTSTGAAIPAKNGVYSTLTASLLNSNQQFDSGYPSGQLANGAGYTVTYKVTYAAGKATSASNPITEAVIVNDVITTDYTSGAAGVQANTISRVALSGIGSKNASDTLTLSWTHKILGQ